MADICTPRQWDEIGCEWTKMEDALPVYDIWTDELVRSVDGVFEEHIMPVLQDDGLMTDRARQRWRQYGDVVLEIIANSHGRGATTLEGSTRIGQASASIYRSASCALKCVFDNADRITPLPICTPKFMHHYRSLWGGVQEAVYEVSLPITVTPFLHGLLIWLFPLDHAIY
jgi:hypothetical protein